MGVIESAKKLSEKCDSLTKSILRQTNLSYVTNPLNYAWQYHESYLKQYSGLGAKTLLLGMNPGPYGMAQCGVPFGATNIAKIANSADKYLPTLTSCLSLAFL